ncbi:unnamed protein product [Caenorhabditis nigoni]
MLENTTIAFSKWLTLSKVIASAGFFSTTISVATFLILTVFFVKTSYDNYKRYMIVFSVLGFGLAAIEAAVNPIFHSYNYGFVMFSLAHPFGAPSDVSFTLLLVYTGFYAATISFLTAQFFYRYLAIVHPQMVPVVFGGWKLILWILYACYFGIQWALGVTIFARLDEVATDYMEDEIVQYYGKRVEEIAMCAVVAFDKNHKLRWFNLMCVLNMTLIMMVQYGFIITFGWRMSVKIREAVSMLSTVTIRLHTQFFKVLILVPTITLFMPVFILMYTPMFDFQLRFPSGVMLSAFSFFPAMDAIIVMYILTDYRNAIKNMFEGFSATVHGAMRVSNVVDSTQMSRWTP